MEAPDGRKLRNGRSLLPLEGCSIPDALQQSGARILWSRDKWAGGTIDEQTNIFTLGALIFEFFGRFSDEEIHQRYCNNQFIPCTLPNWQLSEESYQVATKAVSLNKSERYLTFAEFWYEWKAANSNF